ncbi:MAG: alpha/beta hydrolase-fold protein [Cetobacterium sp.]|uniref:alpha/beta hydrolase n=1 Tax=unclassified Cetobacterium TaxID=2630983 RepID=UPI00163B8323|nr:alpha/beta hydrolase-fold protein [Cetobacterium sp. 2A]MBC2855656.1 esterase [Cetobacterium sp. 2A]
MIINFLIFLAVSSILFYVITYPFEFKIQRRLNRILAFKEVKYIKNSKFSYNNYSLEEIEKLLKIQEYSIETRCINEKVRYITVKPRDMVEENPPCLILLHGLRDYPEDWINRGKLLEIYLTLKEKKEVGDIIFILPYSGFEGESWYTNFYEDPEHRYEDWLNRELLHEMRKKYPKSKLGIAGFSMGGYGAFKIGIKHIYDYDVIGSFSGAVSLIRMSINRRIMRVFKYLYVPKFLFNDVDRSHFIRVFGSWGYKILKQDPYSMVKKLTPSQIKGKKFYVSVGAEDKAPYLMFQQWIDIVGRLKKYGFNFQARIYEKEIHTWGFVSKDLPNFLKYFYDSTK